MVVLSTYATVVPGEYTRREICDCEQEETETQASQQTDSAELRGRFHRQHPVRKGERISHYSTNDRMCLGSLKNGRVETEIMEFVTLA